MRRQYGAAIRLNHIPSGLIAIVRNRRDRITPAMNRLVRSLLAAKIAKTKECPDWKEGSGVIQHGVGDPLIRTWTLDPYQSVRDMRTGKSVEFKPEMLNGNIDELLTANTRKDLDNVG
jgi:peptide chain release factor 2